MTILTLRELGTLSEEAIESALPEPKGAESPINSESYTLTLESIVCKARPLRVFAEI